MKYRETIKDGNELHVINISLGEGRNYFSVTASTYLPVSVARKEGYYAHSGDVEVIDGKKYLYISGGCQHDLVREHWPQYAIFVDLHLCDDNGVNMYPVDNGLYLLQTKGVTDYNGVEIAQAADKQDYREKLAAHLPALREKAAQAIKMLCDLTGETYEQSGQSYNFRNY